MDALKHEIFQPSHCLWLVQSKIQFSYLQIVVVKFKIAIVVFGIYPASNVPDINNMKGSFVKEFILDKPETSK